MIDHNLVLSPESPGPLPGVGVNVVCSNPNIHEIHFRFPETSRQALVATIISAFRKPNKLVVNADSFSFNIEFSSDEVDVAATSAHIDEDLVLVIRVPRLGRHFL